MAPNVVEKIADALHTPGVHKQEEDKAAATAAGEAKKPIFEKEKVTVIFVLGGPGAGVSLPNSTQSTPTRAHHR
jgi:UMP-CMP kinase